MLTVAALALLESTATAFPLRLALRRKDGRLEHKLSAANEYEAPKHDRHSRVARNTLQSQPRHAAHRQAIAERCRELKSDGEGRETVNSYGHKDKEASLARQQASS